MITRPFEYNAYDVVPGVTRQAAISLVENARPEFSIRLADPVVAPVPMLPVEVVGPVTELVPAVPALVVDPVPALDPVLALPVGDAFGVFVLL